MTEFQIALVAYIAGLMTSTILVMTAIAIGLAYHWLSE